MAENTESTMSITCTSSLPDESAPGTLGNIDVLKKLRLKNVGKLIVASLNINSISNKLDRLEELVKDYVGIYLF